MSVIGDALKQAERDAGPRQERVARAGGLRDKSIVQLADRLAPASAGESSTRWARPGDHAPDQPRSRLLLDWVALLVAAAAFVAAAVTINGGGVAPTGPAASAQTPAHHESEAMAGKSELQGPRDEVPSTVVSAAAPAPLEPAPPAPGRELGVPNTATADEAGREEHRPLLIDHDRFRVHGVLLGSGPPLAVVNGVTLGVGQHVDGAEVVSIGRSRVRLRVDAAEFEVPIRTRPGEN